MINEQQTTEERNKTTKNKTKNAKTKNKNKNKKKQKTKTKTKTKTKNIPLLPPFSGRVVEFKTRVADDSVVVGDG